MLRWIVLLLWPSAVFAAGICEDPPYCKKECAAGQTRACIELGLAMQYRGVPGNPRALYEQACAQGDEHACYHADLELDRDADATVATTRKACEAGDAASCARVADLIDHGIDRTDSTAYYRRACEDGDARACALAATRLSGTPDGRTLATRSCDLGSTLGCELCASIRDDANDGRQLRCAERACAAGGAHGCWLQAELVPDKSDATVAELLQKSCKRGEAQACCALAVHYQNGAGVPKSAARAGELRRAAAKLGLQCDKPARPPRKLKR
jgi:TPR repeat protein